MYAPLKWQTNRFEIPGYFSVEIGHRFELTAVEEPLGDAKHALICVNVALRGAYFLGIAKPGALNLDANGSSC